MKNWLAFLLRSNFQCRPIGMFLLFSYLGSSTPIAAFAQEAAELNRQVIKHAIDDMDKLHEAKPNGGGPGWKVHPLIVMGVNPYGWSVPKDWIGVRFSEWKAILPWFLIYQEENANSVTNSGVEIRQFQLFCFLKSKQAWIRIGIADKARWSSAGLVNAESSTKDLFKFSKGEVELFQPSNKFMIHGGLKQYELPWDAVSNKADVGAIFVSLQHRLQNIDANKVDDRNSARYLVLVGADYYPFVGATMQDLKASYNPGLGMGRFMQVKNEWRLSTFIVKEGSTRWEQLYENPPAVLNPMLP
ncbi:MAG TPA: hypothetical protein PK129_06710 [Cellvibrionaceae bacterium]|nr:hypothetical protein [Cellvibrionaceae bacterium]